MSAEWPIFRIQDIAAEMGDAPFGSNLKNHDYTEIGALVVQGKNIQGRTCDWSDRRYVSVDKYQQLTRNQCREGDLVFPKVGTIGKVGILTPAKGIDYYVLSTNTMRLRVNDQIACRDFVYYYFSWPRTSALINVLNANSVQPVFNFTSLKNFEITLPSLEEQRRISTFLCVLDDRIALLRETNATLEAVAQALFKSWFVDFDPVHARARGEQPAGLAPEVAALFPDSFEESELGMVPKGWRGGAFGDVCARIESGGTPKRSVPEYWGGGVPWLSSGEVRNPIVFDTKETITDLGVRESAAKLWPQGTTVVAMYGATAGEVCLLAKPTTANQACCGLIPKSQTRAFMFMCARRERVALASKSSGSAQQNLNKGLIESHSLVLPPNEVLNAYEESAGALLNCWIANDQQAQTLAALRDTLLPRLISGQLRLPEAEAMVREAQK